MKTLDDLDLKGQRVWMRVDFNVPLDKQRQVTDDTRIRAVIPSIRKVLDEGGALVLASHLGRPKGKVVAELSLRPVADYLSRLLDRPVAMAPDCVGEEVRKRVEALQSGEILVLENLRFHAEEEKDGAEFCGQLAAMADIYVNDAFAVSHRAHASVHGITRQVKVCAAGYQLAKEMKYFHETMEQPKRPLAMIIGGAKISTKIGLLETLLTKVDYLLIGGAMANTFLRAEGKSVGKSLVEEEHVATAKSLLDKAAQQGIEMILPVDAVVADSLDQPGEAEQVAVDDVPAGKQILDVGPETIELFKTVLSKCATIVWNGPVGAFETPPFHKGTFVLADYLADLDALKVVGGGDSAAAVRRARVADQMSYVSTGGGAFLELLEGKTLPGIAALQECAQRSARS